MYAHKASRLHKLYKWLFDNRNRIDIDSCIIHRRYRKNRKGNLKVVGYYVTFPGYLEY